MNLDLDEIIKALAHPVRRDILNWLKDPKSRIPGTVAQPRVRHLRRADRSTLRLSQSTVSAHLGNLQRAGLISSQKAGQWHFFKRNEDVIQAFLSTLSKEL
jgi:DNA-binding transcriptional ArsR family regulator